ncbi:unnamed protein product [Absidia cylindrospora]
MPIPNTNTAALERPTTRKTTSKISDIATNNKNDNASPRRPSQKPKGAPKPTDMVLTRKRGTHTDTVAVTTIPSTAITTDCDVVTPLPPIPPPSCTSTPTPVENPELSTKTKQAQRRKRTRSRKASKRFPAANHTVEKPAITTTATSHTGDDTSSKVEHGYFGQTEDSIALPSSSQQAPLSPTTAVENENGMVPEAPAATIDDNPTTDILGSKDNTQDSKEALEALAQIEVEFARFRQKVFDEKMEALYEEMVMIEKGIHPDQLEMMKEIEKKRYDCIEMATAKRDMGRLSHQNRFESTVYQADLTFTRKRKELRTDIHQSLGKRRLKLNDEHLNTMEGKPGNEKKNILWGMYF